MRRRIDTTRSLSLALALALGVAPAAMASSDSDGGAMALVWQFVNFILLVAVIYFAARKAVSAFFADRREGIKGQLDEAAALLRESELRHGEWQRKLADLDEELTSIRDIARRRAEEERDRILADARAAAERIRTDATAAVDQELRRAKEELALEASALSVEMAARILDEKVSDSDRDRLMDEFISSVERPPTGLAGSGR